MSAIVIEGLSPSALAAFERLAVAKDRTLAEEVKNALEEVAQGIPKRLPMYIPSEEISAPFDLPYQSIGVPVQAIPGGPRLPDPAFLPWREEPDESV